MSADPWLESYTAEVEEFYTMPVEATAGTVAAAAEPAEAVPGEPTAALDTEPEPEPEP